MIVSIDIDSKQLEEAFRKAPAKVTAGLSLWIEKTSFKMEREAKIEAANVLDTGQTQSSISTNIFGLKGQVKPTTKHAIFAHNGRKPGRMPPFKEGTALARWANKHGIPPFLLARSIGRKGTKGYKFMDKAFKTVKPSAENEARKTLDSIVGSI